MLNGKSIFRTLEEHERQESMPITLFSDLNTFCRSKNIGYGSDKRKLYKDLAPIILISSENNRMVAPAWNGLFNRIRIIWKYRRFSK